ncbi:MAG TPA: phosphoadenylyl-sulfate reductase [Rhodospirillaceae bacterium]|nr:phosphoadenylyl-sulfate reductase [Rhodospirillaceae bacterium]
MTFEALRQAFGSLDGKELVRAICAEFPGKVAVTSSFGAEAAVLLDLVAQIDPDLPVLFFDTEALFDETLSYQQQLTQSLGLRNLRVIRPAAEDLKTADELWRRDVDQCCHLRKVLPLARVVHAFKVLLDGRKQFHGGAREKIETIEEGPEGLIKVSPLARWREADIEAAFVERSLPRHPLVAQGYRSIGCWPCSRPTLPGEPVRAGRWAGAAKTECGIHNMKKSG